jgi:hypothetical protein
MTAPRRDTDDRFALAIGAAVSLFVHIVVLVVLVLSPDLARRDEETIEFMPLPPEPTDAPDAPPRPELDRDPDDLPDLPELTPSDGPPSPNALVLPPRAPLPSPEEEGLTFRERLRRRDALFERDVQDRAARTAALARWRARHPAAGPSESVHACRAKERGPAVRVIRSKNLDRYVDFIPTGLFPPRYARGMAQVIERKRDGVAPLGHLEFAMPPREVPIPMDIPEGSIFAVGRPDARCIIGFSWTDEVFPMTFKGIPARYVDRADNVYEVLIEVKVHKDGTFRVRVEDGDPLPFTKGALYDHVNVSKKMRSQATGARVVRDVVGAIVGN